MCVCVCIVQRSLLALSSVFIYSRYLSVYNYIMEDPWVGDGYEYENGRNVHSYVFNIVYFPRI
jgi:hypothetical protein